MKRGDREVDEQVFMAKLRTDIQRTRRVRCWHSARLACVLIMVPPTCPKKQAHVESSFEKTSAKVVDKDGSDIHIGGRNCQGK